MIDKNEQEYFARMAVKQFLKSVDCQDVKEMITALTVLISRAAFLIEHKADSEAAQLALYEPYAQLIEGKE